MATVQTIPTPTEIKPLIDPLDKTSNRSGFQRAHIIGEDFAKIPGLAWFRKILGTSGQNAGINGITVTVYLTPKYLPASGLAFSA